MSQECIYYLSTIAYCTRNKTLKWCPLPYIFVLFIIKLKLLVMMENVI
jgi:hypothetical protein